MRRLMIILTPVLLAACSSAPETPASPGQGGSADIVATGMTEIYDPEVVPAAAKATAKVAQSQTGVTVRLNATGLIANRTYGAHLHTKPCAAKPDAAGPHYQHQADPSKPSVDPSFANPANEVWLDLTTDAQGAGAATSTQTWTFDELTPPRSLILHAQATRTAAGVAGTAGDRVACLTLPVA